MLPRALARFNRRVTNPFMRTFAGRLPPWAIIEHTGRRSGRRYRTPVWAFRADRGVVVALTYGRDVDWLRNLEAASGGRLRRAGRVLPVGAPEVIHGAAGLALLPLPIRTAVRPIGVDTVVRLTAP